MKCKWGYEWGYGSAWPIKEFLKGCIESFLTGHITRSVCAVYRNGGNLIAYRCSRSSSALHCNVKPRENMTTTRHADTISQRRPRTILYASLSVYGQPTHDCARHHKATKLATSWIRSRSSVAFFTITI